MAVKMRKWSPWPAARKFAVAVRLMRLEVLAENGGGDDEESGSGSKFVAIKIKWKGEPKFFPLMAPFIFQARKKVERSSQRMMKTIVEWDDEYSWFHNTCCFSLLSLSHNKFGPWEIAFTVLSGEKMDSKAKMVTIGGVSINISEIVGENEMETSSIEQKLPLNLQIDGIARDATLTVLFKFVEVRESQDSGSATSRTKSIDAKYLSLNECNVKARRRSLSLEEVCLDEADEPSTSTSTSDAVAVAQGKSRVEGNTLESDKKERWFMWKSRRFSMKRAKTWTKEEKSENCVDEESRMDARIQSSEAPVNDNDQKEDPTESGSGSSCQHNKDGVWEERELVSRDGQAKLKAPFFFASFDQRSDKAAGASACTALVAMISHWLHSNSHAMPDRSEFDDLIMQGSSEWRKLCEDTAIVKDFPNKHFDLDTVLRANIRPVLISHNDSFVGFFGAKTFDSLKGAMSFDDIWDEISTAADNDTASRIYIVSWNDHFFVLKAEANAYYIIDTLGERLYEGCNQAYIIRFDDKAVMHRPKAAENENMDETEQDEGGICSGKECCREFIKRFLAAIPLKELEEEEKKDAVSYFCLHQRLQIEFNYSCLMISPASSSAMSSPFSPPTTSSSSPSSE